MYKLVDHSIECQAGAIISAIQNLRDSSMAVGRRMFHDAVFGGVVEEWAEYYLNEGIQTCRCPIDSLNNAMLRRLAHHQSKG